MNERVWWEFFHAPQAVWFFSLLFGFFNYIQCEPNQIETYPKCKGLCWPNELFISIFYTNPMNYSIGSSTFSAQRHPQHTALLSSSMSRLLHSPIKFKTEPVSGRSTLPAAFLHNLSHALSHFFLKVYQFPCLHLLPIPGCDFFPSF